MGVIIIMRALHGLPPDFLEWPLPYWRTINDLAQKVLEADAKKVL